MASWPVNYFKGEYKIMKEKPNITNKQEPAAQNDLVQMCIKGTKQWNQFMVGRITNDLKDLHDKAPDASPEISKLIDDIGKIMDQYMFKNIEQPVKDIVKIGDVIKLRVL